MIVLQADNAESLFLKGLVACKTGTEQAPRGLHTIEARDTVCFELTDTRKNLVTNPYRKLNYTFGLFESIAMWNGINNVETFMYYNRNMEKYTDGGNIFYGSYGEEFVKQHHHILKLLQNDRDSRQAIITIWKKNPPESKDIPCTVMLHFMIRDFHLNLNVYMRSNDIWLGFPYDITNFSRIQQAFAAELEVRVGVLRHVVGSLHMYSGDIFKAENALRYQGVPDLTMPLCTHKDLIILNDTARRIRQGIETLEYHTDFIGIHSSLLYSHGEHKRGLPTVWPQPYNELMSQAKEVHGYFKHS